MMLRSDFLLARWDVGPLGFGCIILRRRAVATPPLPGLGALISNFDGGNPRSLYVLAWGYLSLIDFFPHYNRHRFNLQPVTLTTLLMSCTLFFNLVLYEFYYILQHISCYNYLTKDILKKSINCPKVNKLYVVSEELQLRRSLHQSSRPVSPPP